ncbi:transmembrane protein, putative [Medicago truncatula]|uniref:Transmembrane protein, putative n=1 Tax=Medicago truncatula TaxID=3880 RepID=G7I7U1_MEDTR|nr:transmembrane protein, putative [Medicago truncatula]
MLGVDWEAQEGCDAYCLVAGVIVMVGVCGFANFRAGGRSHSPIKCPWFRRLKWDCVDSKESLMLVALQGVDGT